MLDGSTQRKRIRVIIGAVIGIGVIVVLRLFSLQVVHVKSYREKAERQYVTPAGGTFDRGNIYFSTKNEETVAAATVVSGFKVAIAPARIQDASLVADALAQQIPEFDREDFLTKAQKKRDPYEEVAWHISDVQADAITKLRLSGVSLYREKWRSYPGGSLAAQTIGFVSYKKDTLVGTYGLEEYYNDTLSRTSGESQVNFFAEIFANVESTLFKNTTTNGDIVTSIEPTVQTQLEQSVGRVASAWASDGVGALVMDPYSGEIVALAYTPTFDLNAFGSVKDFSIFSNPLTQYVYEMGSIIKPLVVAGALDKGVITPETTYTDYTGSVTVRDRTISNFDKKGRGVASIQTILDQSLNTGMVFIEGRMGHSTFKEYMLGKYRLGEKTGIDLPGESSGLVSNLSGTNDVNYATASFGQGIATTPINIVRGYAILANGGTLVTPHIGRAVLEESGATRTIPYPTTPAVLKPETIQTITGMLVHVVDKSYNRAHPHYSVAAKTGTAQIARPDGAGYYTDRNLHSLIGFFPAYAPRFVIYFFNIYPKNNAQFAIQTLADPFFGMVEFLGNYYGIAPDR